MLKHNLIERFLNALNYLETKYVNILEEIVSAEAEIYMKDRWESTDYIKLYCYTLIKKIIVEELELDKPLMDNTVSLIEIEA